MKVEMQHTAKAPNNFEQQYLSLREKEGRVYIDAQVKQLPEISNNHPLYNEWKMRKFSAENLADYFQQKKKSLNILEVGCGNGWLSHKLSLLKNVSVTGLDVNSVELEQAKRVFGRSNIRFVYGELKDTIQNGEFDVILFAASLQYFSSLKKVIETALQKLRANGEIHIVDTHFYGADELQSASQRSKQYFTESGFPMMSQFYFHQSWEELKEFSIDILFDPFTFKNRILKRSPFPWISIRKC